VSQTAATAAPCITERASMQPSGRRLSRTCNYVDYYLFTNSKWMEG